MERIRKGDEVIVITGKDKGKRGVVLTLVGTSRVMVEGVNVVKKHTRPNPMKNVTGGITDKTMSVDRSNVMLFDPATGKGGRIQIKFASRAATEQLVRVRLSGVSKLARNGTLTLLSSTDPDAGNSLDEPTRIAPQTREFKGVSRDFILTLPAYSVAALEFDAQ